MSKLKIRLIKGEDFEGDMPTTAKVYIHNTVPTATIDLQAGVATRYVKGTRQTIIAHQDGDTSYSAIIVPQRIDNRQPLVEVEMMGVSYLFESKFLFKPGTEHLVNLVISENPDKVKISIGGEKQTTIMQAGSVGADGFYRLRIGNLQPSTAYTVRPFAKNRNGEAVGKPLSFTTPTAVVLEEAGMLSVVIGDDIYKYTTISIAGPLNGDDLRTLRYMAGRGIDGSATNGRLADIDISGARIVAGGGVYDAARYSEDDVVGVGLFAACSNLKNIKLPMDVTKIEKDAFLNCSALRSIVIPATVSSIIPSAGCTSLEDISVSGANTSYTSSDGVLLSGDAKSILWFPMGKRGDYALPATVTAVGPYAFRDCSIGKFVFPAGLTKIGECAFYNSKVKEVVLPSTLKMLPTGVFQKCADLKTVRLGNDVELLSDYVFDGCPLTDLYITAPLPPVCNSNTFATTGADFVKTCRLHVPKGRKKYYRANAKWNVFDNIVEE